VENRTEVPTWTHVQRQLQGKNGSDWLNTLNDFHLLYFLGTTEGFDSNVFDKIIQAILNPTSVNIPELKGAIDILLQRITPQTSSGPKEMDNKTELLVQLLSMGYTEAQATEALFATGGNSVEAAVNYLLSSM